MAKRERDCRLIEAGHTGTVPSIAEETNRWLLRRGFQSTSMWSREYRKRNFCPQP